MQYVVLQSNYTTSTALYPEDLPMSENFFFFFFFMKLRLLLLQEP